MAGSLKVKIAISGFAVLILVTIHLLDTNFFAPVTIKRWSKISWDDFRGIPQPFSSYEAAISSSIYLEYDSSRSRYHAYAGQNNVRSWAKRSRPEQDYELNHEQYHFNITELHARKLNEYIAEDSNATLRMYRFRLSTIKIDLRRMQNQYDNETHHSTNFDKQRRWEYRIDSLMTLESGWITDHFSGAQVYFPSPPDSYKGLTDNSRYRKYFLAKYGMQLSITSHQMESVDFKSIADYYRKNGTEQAPRVRSFSLDTTDKFKASMISEDTAANVTEYNLWVGKDLNVYHVKARFPNKTSDTTGYSQIASSFIKSFRIVDTDNYWIEKMNQPGKEIIFYKFGAPRKKKDTSDDYCIIIGPEGRHGFYRNPIYTDDGVLLAYDYVHHADTLHYRDLLLLNKDTYSYTPTPEGQIYFIPNTNIPAGNHKIEFGYVLLEDSAKGCYEYYHETLSITPKGN